MSYQTLHLKKNEVNEIVVDTRNYPLQKGAVLFEIRREDRPRTISSFKMWNNDVYTFEIPNETVNSMSNVDGLYFYQLVWLVGGERIQITENIPVIVS